MRGFASLGLSFKEGVRGEVTTINRMQTVPQKKRQNIIDDIRTYVLIYHRLVGERDMAREICGEDELSSELYQEKRPVSEADLPPEYCRYRDEGCELAGSCLNCPFPQCIYDEPGGRQRLRKSMRNKEINRLFTREGKSVKELAYIFGVSQRTIQRALKDSLKKI